jgi:hypothetical protein
LKGNGIVVNNNIINRLMFEYKNYNHIGLGHFNISMELINELQNGTSVKEVAELLKNKGLSSLSELEISEITTSIHPKGIELLELIKGRKLTEKESIYLLHKKLPLYAMMNYYTEDDMKVQLLDALMYTNSLIRYEDLKLIISNEEIKTHIKSKEYRPSFVIRKDKDNNYFLDSYYKRIEEGFVPLDIKTIDFDKLVLLTGLSTKAHFNAANLNESPYLTLQGVRELLDSTIIAIYFIRKNLENKKNNIVKEPPFYKLIKFPFDNLSKMQIDNLKRTAVNVNSSVCISFDEIAKALANAFQQGNNIKITIDGITYYSCETKVVDDVYAKKISVK